MAKINFKKFFSRYITITIVALNIIFGIVLGLIIRNQQINKSKKSFQDRIEYAISEIQNEISSDYSSLQTLSEIVASQINTPRSFYDFNSLFTHILSSEKSINSIFITLSPNAVDLDESLYPLLDTLNRYNVVWVKNAANIVFIDSLEDKTNDFYFNTVKNESKTVTFNSHFNSDYLGSKFVKTVAFPIFEGTHFIGVIGFDINFDFINSILIHNDIEQKTFLTDEDGVLIYNRGEKTYISKGVDVILGDKFKEYQNKILNNVEFTEKKGSDILFFRTFTPKPLNINWKIGLFGNSKEIYSKANWYFIGIVFTFTVISLLVILFFRGFIKRIANFINNLTTDIENVYKGKLNNEIKVIDSFFEIHQITDKLEKLRLRLLKLSKIYSQIQSQEINQRLENLDKDDELAKSINQTIDTIVERTATRHEALLVKQKNDWINDGLNILHEAARINENSIEILTDRINSQISSYSDAFLSSFFIYYQDEESSEELLEAVSTFGLDEKRGYKKTIKIGEGVVGTVAQERKKQYFEKIPSDYHIVVGGLSEMHPKSILVQPLEYEGEFYGILEIAFLKKLQDFELTFFEKASSEIALSIKNILNNISTNKMLEKMKLQTQEIEKAQALLQSKIKELSNKEKEAHEREARMQSMLNAVNNTLMTIEYTTNGILLTANQRYLDKMNFTLEELKGVNVLDLVKSERNELEQVIRKVSKGEYYEKTMKRFTKYGEVKWLHSTYTPYYEPDGSISKVLYFAFDVTETNEKATRFEKEIRILKKHISLLREKL